MKRFGLKFVSFMIALLMLCTMLPMTVLADEEIPKVTINYAHKDTTFHIFYVATWNAKEYVSVDAFADYTGSYDMSDAGKSRDLANALAEYVVQNSVVAQTDGKTDANGTVVFSGLATGIYLVLGDSYELDGYTYYPSPFVLEVVGNTDVTVDEKYEREDNTDDGTDEPENPDNPGQSDDEDGDGKPDTGDHAKVELWIALLVVDSIALIVIVLLGRRRKEAKG